MTNEVTLQDIQLKASIRRSNSHYSTILLYAELLKEWTPQGFQRVSTREEESGDADVSNKFRKGETVVVKLFPDGPEEERKAAAKKRRDNEYSKLFDLSKKLAETESDKNWFVIALGIGEVINSHLSGPFVVLEQGECSLGQLLHHRKDVCKTQADQVVSRIEVEDHPLYTKDHCFSFIVQIHGALNFLHNCGMMHRDLKSYNVLLFNDKTLCKLCDFEDCRHVSPRMTAKMGTTWWRAPEVYLNTDDEGNTEYGIAADWYSFGLLMCEMLFREEPFMCYYTRTMSDKSLEPSRVLSDKFLSALPKPTEVDRLAMHIDNAIPGSPKVVINTERCEFPTFREVSNAPKLWDLVDQLLLWNPRDRISGKDLSARIESDIAPYATGSPPPICLPDSQDRTDTGARSNETVMSWKPAVAPIPKVYLAATECDLTDDTIVEEIEKRLQERIYDICGMLSEDPGVQHLRFNINFKKQLKRFVLSVSGESSCSKKTALFCETNSEFVSHMTDQFKYHHRSSVKGLKFEILKPSVQQEK